jgi:FixJ family two-component response regulator
MSGISGFKLRVKWNAERCRISPIVISPYSNAQMRMQASSAGEVGFLTRPFDDEDLLESWALAGSLRFVDTSALSDIPAMRNVMTIGSRRIAVKLDAQTTEMQCQQCRAQHKL